MKYIMFLLLTLVPSVSHAAGWVDPFAPPPESAVESDGWWRLVGAGELDEEWWLSQYVPKGVFLREALGWSVSVETVSDMVPVDGVRQ